MVAEASYPPLQKTQGRGTHSSATGKNTKEGWATRPSGLTGTVTVFEGSFGAAGEYAGASDLITVEMPILRQSVANGIVNLVSVPVP